MAASTIKHPPTAKMVEKAIFDLNDRQGTSLYMIKKYITDNFEVDVNSNNNLKTRITKCVKDHLRDGILIQTSGLGANGKFKFTKDMKENLKKEEKIKLKKEEKKNLQQENLQSISNEITVKKSMISKIKKKPTITREIDENNKKQIADDKKEKSIKKKKESLKKKSTTEKLSSKKKSQKVTKSSSSSSSSTAKRQVIKFNVTSSSIRKSMGKKIVKAAQKFKK